MTSPMTLVEAYHGKVRPAEWNWAMSRLVVEPVTKGVADEAIRLLLDTGLHGHKYAIDAVLAVAREPAAGPGPSSSPPTPTT